MWKSVEIVTVPSMLSLLLTVLCVLVYCKNSEVLLFLYTVSKAAA